MQSGRGRPHAKTLRSQLHSEKRESVFGVRLSDFVSFSLYLSDLTPTPVQ